MEGKMNTFGQETLFEEDFLKKTAGSIVRDPDFAITEIVANAWDAGATKVSITLPMKLNDEIVIDDNGHGMTTQDFHERWMCLGYNRIKKQGRYVEFPEGITNKRRAFGKNGIGRHAMFCFCDSYQVRTAKNGEGSIFDIEISSGEQPWRIKDINTYKDRKHGTLITGKAIRNIPEYNKIRDTLCARFFHDPNFEVYLNEEKLDLEEYDGLHEKEVVTIEDYGEIDVQLVESKKSARTNQLQGFTFRVNNRMVGDTSWIIDPYYPIDSRTLFGKRFSILVNCDFMEDSVLPDWTGFVKNTQRFALYKALNDFVLIKYNQYSAEKIDETKSIVFRDNIDDLRDLSRPIQDEIEVFTNAFITRAPTIQPEVLDKAVSSFIALQKTRNGQHLLESIGNMSEKDIATLDGIISEWSIQDMASVLTEIDRRIATIRAIEILADKNDTDELHILHPLITEARWVFGPEFESSEFVFNATLKNAVNKVFDVNTVGDDYPNWKKRCDLLVTPTSTISTTGIEDFSSGDSLSSTKRVLLIELKKGHFKISREEMMQAEGYVDDIRNSGLIQKNCFFDVFVVGHELAPISTTKELKDDNDKVYARVKGVTYSSLTDTAHKRLFRLKDHLKERYNETNTGSSILNELLTSTTIELPFTDAAGAK
jgi:hypothetical protein